MAGGKQNRAFGHQGSKLCQFRLVFCPWALQPAATKFIKSSNGKLIACGCIGGKMDAEKIKKDFPIFSGKKPPIYLDNAATTQKPRQVLDAEMEFYKKYNSNIHRGMNFLSVKATEMYEREHEKTAKFINSQNMEEIIFTKNATESINLLAYSLGETLQRGDEVLITKMEHHANIVPWQELAKRKKVKLIFSGITVDGKLDMKDFESKISGKTKIISVTMASNILGAI